MKRKRVVRTTALRHMDVPAAAGGERGAKVTPFDLSGDDRDRTSESSLLTAALAKQPLQSTGDWITPDWPAPANVRAIATTRLGGVSAAPYDSLNLATHVGDDPAAVLENRRRLRAALTLAYEPLWLDQVHGTIVVDAAVESALPPPADASVAMSATRPCVVMTADCLPVLFCDRAGTRVAAAHAGWRGLVHGVLESTVRKLETPPGQLLAWLGPAIEPAAFEVGAEVKEAFTARHAGADRAFVRNERDRWQADLYALAKIELRALGVDAIFGGGETGFAEGSRFYSYRRDGRTGRMATMVWLTLGNGQRATGDG
jgi:polyphenol oxidase